MDHPFFNAPDFPLHLPEGEALLNAMVKAEGNVEEIKLIYKHIGPVGLSLQPLTLPAAADKVWAELLSNVTKAGLLESFINRINGKYPSFTELTEAIDSIKKARPGASKKFFADGTFILDLKKQRPTITKTTSDTATAKVLLVRGDARSGKSHCRYVFENIGNDKQATVVYIFEGMCADVKSTIEYIYSSLGVDTKDIPPQGLTDDDSWFKAICADLKKVVSKQSSKKELVKLWIAMDDLGYINSADEDGVMRPVPIIDKRIRHFFEQFAVFMLDPSFARHFRLMLINYAEPSKPTKWKADTFLEIETNEDDIQQGDVEEFITDWAIAKKKTIPETDVKKLAAEIIDIAENPPPAMAALSRPQRIHDVLKLKLEQIEES